jgi:uncharacterized C2H2 Zn-finger protein
MDAVNIISFDVPFPANYGGVIDVYYKLVWLKQAGIKIHLHCFSYGRSVASELEVLCEKVYYYKRKTGIVSNFSLLPYTVKSRQSKELEKNLLSNNFPILFEVLHTCYLLNDERFKHRKKIYRHSNIEHYYYQELSKSENDFLKKIYLKIEAKKLKRFETILNFADVILAVNQKDTQYFKVNYPKSKIHYLPSFHENEQITSLLGKGKFILFHGNLSVSENYEAALWLIKNVFSKISYKVIITGLNPPEILFNASKNYNHIELIASPDSKKMDELISTAHLHILYTKQPTGLKLKLLNVLFKGRFVICNSSMISGTGIQENSCLLFANEPLEFIKEINFSLNKEFTQLNFIERQNQVFDFNNFNNCAQLIEIIND